MLVLASAVLKIFANEVTSFGGLDRAVVVVVQLLV